MDMVFLCGSLEPGHDGVGDYTRRLAGQLLMQGHKVAALALNDPSIQETWIGTQYTDGINVPVVRITSSLSSNKRFSYARKWIEEQNPRVLSLQFVIFSYNPKGLPFNLASQLVKLGVQRTWHIMFHELWVGMSTSATWKHILWGKVQQLIIRSMIHRLKPAIIHTHTLIYQEHLKKWGLGAKILPLFSNIPVEAASKLADNNLFNSKEINLVVFGTMHTHSRIDLLAAEANRFISKKGIRVNLLSIGRCGNEFGEWATIWQSAGLTLNILGEQSSEIISAILKSVSIGITSTPLPLVEKSGTVAAMREHGLPVICIAETWILNDNVATTPLEGVFFLEEGIIEECLAYKRKGQNTVPSVTTIATLFSNSFS